MKQPKPFYGIPTCRIHASNKLIAGIWGESAAISFFLNRCAEPE